MLHSHHFRIVLTHCCPCLMALGTLLWAGGVSRGSETACASETQVDPFESALVEHESRPIVTLEGSLPEQADHFQIVPCEFGVQECVVDIPPSPCLSCSEANCCGNGSRTICRSCLRPCAGGCPQAEASCGPCVESAMHAPVICWHALLEWLHQADQVFESGPEESWIVNREHRDYCRCRRECQLVNWRLNSMYLEGCMPPGYDLLCFLSTVPQIQWFPTPLFVNGPIEPGGSPEQAAEVDGPDYRPLTSVSLDITPPEGALPPDRARQQFAQAGTNFHPPGTQRLWGATNYYWNASLLNHQPLYFEDVNLERHGFSYGVFQPVVSGIKFFGTIPTLPYRMTAQPPQYPVYTLGEQRPGSHANYVHEFPPVDANAAAVQALTIVGLIFIIP